MSTYVKNESIIANKTYSTQLNNNDKKSNGLPYQKASCDEKVREKIIICRIWMIINLKFFGEYNMATYIFL